MVNSWGSDEGAVRVARGLTCQQLSQEKQGGYCFHV